MFCRLYGEKMTITPLWWRWLVCMLYIFASCIFKHICDKGHYGDVQYFIHLVNSSCESMASFITSPSSCPVDGWLLTCTLVGKSHLFDMQRNWQNMKNSSPPWAHGFNACQDHYFLLHPTSLVEDNSPQLSRCSPAATPHRGWHTMFYCTLHQGSHQATAAAQPPQLA